MMIIVILTQHDASSTCLLMLFYFLHVKDNVLVMHRPVHLLFSFSFSLCHILSLSLFYTFHMN